MSKASLRIHNSPSRCMSWGSFCLNHSGGFQGRPDRAHIREPSHHARTPSSFSEIQYPVGSLSSGHFVASNSSLCSSTELLISLAG